MEKLLTRLRSINYFNKQYRIINWAKYILGTIIIGVFLWFTVQRAWLSDDAYITLRTVDNFINGNGLVWNVGERVQSFTHPLWMFLLSSVYFITHEAYFTTIFLSLLVSLITIIFLVFFTARNWISGLIGVFTLAMSGAFLDYNTGGLENPLTHLLLILFSYVCFKKESTPQSMLWLTLLASFSAVNRLDTLLLLLPALIYSFWKIRSWKNFWLVLAGLTPLLAWEIFSIVYYGFPFPNTAYAKLNTTLSSAELVRQGFEYFRYTLLNDPWTLIVILLGLVSTFFNKKKTLASFLALGVSFYVLYIIKIGGDFMGGRFFTAPFTIAAILLTFYQTNTTRVAIWVGYLCTGLFFGGIASTPPWRSQNPNFNLERMVSEFSGVVDERINYYPTMGLLSGTPWNELPAHPWRSTGESLREGVIEITVSDSIGLIGYYAGPHVYIIDQFALCDPFLARISFSPKSNWRIGHFKREIPNGYLDSLVSGKNRFGDNDLGIFFQQLSRITRGKLWDSHRWVNIIKMNFGMYDYLLP